MTLVNVWHRIETEDRFRGPGPASTARHLLCEGDDHLDRDALGTPVERPAMQRLKRQCGNDPMTPTSPGGMGR